MNEDIHIEKAASLADKPGAENLATDRAKKFVSDALASKEKAEPVKVYNLFERKPAFAWSTVVIAAAACVAVVIMIFQPTGKDGAQGLLQENVSIHADIDEADSTVVESSDTLAIDAIITND